MPTYFVYTDRSQPPHKWRVAEIQAEQLFRQVDVDITRRRPATQAPEPEKKTTRVWRSRLRDAPDLAKFDRKGGQWRFQAVSFECEFHAARSVIKAIEALETVGRVVEKSGPKKKTGFFDLPGEIRNRIYRRIAAAHHARYQPPRPKNLPHWQSLAQVSRQMRYEYLTRFYELVWSFPIKVRSQDWTAVVNDVERCTNDVAAQRYGHSRYPRELDQWLHLFGESRVPLLRRFSIQHHIFFVWVNLKKGTLDFQKCLMAELSYANVHREPLRTLDDVLEEQHALAEKEIQRLFASVLCTRFDGTKYITIDAISALMAFLKEYDQRVAALLPGSYTTLIQYVEEKIWVPDA